MSAGELAQVVTALALLIGAVVAYRKWRPERDGVTITNAGKVTEMSLSFADRVDKDNDGLREDLDELRREFAQYRADTEKRLSEMAVEVRAARAGEREATRQAESYRQENESLRERVQALETEVRELKANGNPGPHNPT